MMYPCKVIRYFRIKHKIPIREISEMAGISLSRYSEIELKKCKSTPYQQALLTDGLQKLIAQRKEKLTALEADFEKYKNDLLEQKEELS